MTDTVIPTGDLAPGMWFELGSTCCQAPLELLATETTSTGRYATADLVCDHCGTRHTVTVRLSVTPP